MAEEDDSSSFFEFVAVAAFALLLWWLSKKRPIRIEPSTTVQEIKDEFAADPDFSMEKYCQNVIYKPLSSNDLTTATLLGKGWCFRGDRSIVDEKKGFGDAYADKQAAQYTQMKNDEAIFINNKLCVQFRLINSTASPLQTEVLNTTVESTPFNPTPEAPVALSASSVAGDSFVANLNAVSNASGYILDISTDINFMSFVSGYDNKDIGNNLSYIASGLNDGTTYYYRFRAYNINSVSSSSNIITTITEAYTDINNLITGWTAFGVWSTFTSSGNDITSAIKDTSSSVYCTSNNISVVAGTKLKFVINCNIRSGDSPQLYVYDQNTGNIILGTNRLLVQGNNNFLFTVPVGCDTIYLQILNVINFDYRVNLDLEATFV